MVNFLSSLLWLSPSKTCRCSKWGRILNIKCSGCIDNFWHNMAVNICSVEHTDSKKCSCDNHIIDFIIIISGLYCILKITNPYSAHGHPFAINHRKIEEFTKSLWILSFHLLLTFEKSFLHVFQNYLKQICSV